MKINSSHLVGAAIALAAVFFSKLDAQDAPSKAEPQKWEYAHINFVLTKDKTKLKVSVFTPEFPDGNNYRTIPPTIACGLPEYTGGVGAGFIRDVLDLMGAEGWEVYYMPNTKGAYGHPDPRAYETIYFKRSAQ